MYIQGSFSDGSFAAVQGLWPTSCFGPICMPTTRRLRAAYVQATCRLRAAYVPPTLLLLHMHWFYCIMNFIESETVKRVHNHASKTDFTAYACWTLILLHNDFEFESSKNVHNDTSNSDFTAYAYLTLISLNKEFDWIFVPMHCNLSPFPNAFQLQYEGIRGGEVLLARNKMHSHT